MDFTSKTTDEILEFLRLNSNQKVCGRVRSEELVSVSVMNRSVRRNRLFLWALVLVFGGMLFTSCRSRRVETHTMGDVRIFDGFAPKARQSAKPAEIQLKDGFSLKNK